MTAKENVCVDFDGVLNEYEGWKGEDELYHPKHGVREFLDRLSSKYNIIIFTVRPVEKVTEWMNYHKLRYDKITNQKVPAVAYIDDRAIKFNGDYNATLHKLSRFKTWWED